MEQQHLIQAPDALSFITGGNALFTVQNKINKERFTFKVLKDVHAENELKTFVLRGPDNSHDYKRFGTIFIENGIPRFKIGPYSLTHRHAQFFDNFFLDVSIGLHNPQLEIFHWGRCCRCGRILTVPESIMSGIGPECAFQVSILKSFLQ